MLNCRGLHILYIISIKYLMVYFIAMPSLSSLWWQFHIFTGSMWGAGRPRTNPDKSRAWSKGKDVDCWIDRAANICILQSGTFCTTNRELMRIIFNIIWKEFPYSGRLSKKIIRTSKDWYILGRFLQNQGGLAALDWVKKIILSSNLNFKNYCSVKRSTSRKNQIYLVVIIIEAHSHP